MEKLNKVLRALKATGYLDAQFGGGGHERSALRVALLSNGARLAQQLLAKWQATVDGGVPTHHLVHAGAHQRAEAPHGRLALTQPAEFEGVLDMLAANKLAIPVATKQLITRRFGDTEEAAGPTLDVTTASETGRFLVTDYLVPAASGLEKFYNLQRERKIWWMAFAANPSRFALHAHELAAPTAAAHAGSGGDDCPAIAAEQQSVTISARFSFAALDMEHLTLTPAPAAGGDAPRPHQLPAAARRRAHAAPAVIRSVINLETATCGVLVDAYDCKRAVLRLHRRIAPYQVMVACMPERPPASDLADLCAYVAHLVRGAGLRTYETAHMPPASGSGDGGGESDLDEALRKADGIGIPYTIVVANESLQFGLLRLRARDTTLSETIHVSDVPGYLLKIFLSTT